jgi:hypothetical protein
MELNRRYIVARSQKHIKLGVKILCAVSSVLGVYRNNQKSGK